VSLPPNAAAGNSNSYGVRIAPRPQG